MLPLIKIVIPSYMLLSAIGFIAAFIFFYIRVSKKIRKLHIIQLGIFSVLGLAIGSRILFLLTRLPYIIKGEEKILSVIINGGFVFYGGLIGAITGIFLYSKLRKWNFKETINMITPCFPLFHFFGRIGCFLSGCCYGIKSSVGFSMMTEPEVKRFPVQLVESLCCLTIFILLLIIEKRKENANLCKFYLISYAVVRFLLEFLRGDSVRGIWIGLSTSQWISLVIILVVISKMIINHYKTKKIRGKSNGE